MLEKEERKFLQINKLISLIAKKKCLYVLIETIETINNSKIFNDEHTSARKFCTSNIPELTDIKDGEIYKICNEQLLDSIIKTEKFNQLIFLDKGYLLELEKPNTPTINLIVNRNDKNDIYIYELNKGRNNINNKLFISFICEDKNCKGEGVLEIEKNIFTIIHEHEMKHKDYHVNEDSHFTEQLFWNFVYKYKQIKTLQVIILPNDYDLKVVYNNPLKKSFTFLILVDFAKIDLS